VPDSSKRDLRLFRELFHLLYRKSRRDEMMKDKELSAQSALAEFAALRNEALQAFSMQWNIIALQLTATSVLVSFSLTNRSRTGFLLIIPIVSYILNGRYLRSERLVVLIATYIMSDLSPRVPGGLKWEEWLRGRSSPNQILRWFAHGPLVFSVISIITLAWTVPYILHAAKLSTADRWMLGTVWLLDLALTIISIFTIGVIYGARFKKRLSTNRQVCYLSPQGL
jgi:hypothetical protein